MEINNAVIHLYPDSAYIARAAVSLRRGKKIVVSYVMRDAAAALDHIRRAGLEGIPVKYIQHNGR